MSKLGGARPGAGRKKGFAALQAEKQREYVAKILVKEWAPIVFKAVEQAKVGDHVARAWLADRAFGKPQAHVDHTTDGEKLPSPILSHVSSDDVSPEDQEAA